MSISILVEACLHGEKESKIIMSMHYTAFGCNVISRPSAPER